MRTIVDLHVENKCAEAELSLRRFELAELKNGSRPAELDQARAKMLAAEANTNYARTQRDRLKKLIASQAIPQEELDLAESTYDQTSQSYLDLKSAYKMASEGPRREQIEQARAVVAIQQANVERIQDRIKKYTIVSRFDGYVVAKHVELGAWVKTGDPIVEVIELDEVELVTNVAEQHVVGIRPGMEVRIEVPSIPNRKFRGVVKNIVPQADMQARTFPVIIQLKNEIVDGNPLLKSGLYARVDLPTGVSHSATMIPKDAIVLGGQSPMVYLVVPTESADGSSASFKAIPITVKLGIANGNLIQVTGDIEAGQRVVIEGNERLRPGQTVVVVPGRGS